MTSLPLCILWFIGGFVCGAVAAYKVVTRLCARAIQIGTMRRIVEEYEEKFGTGEKA